MTCSFSEDFVTYHACLECEINYSYSLLLSQVGKLTPEERTSKLEPLLSSGWSMVDARDAIYKEFLFTNFNQVCVHVYQGSWAGTVTVILHGI